MLQLIEIIFYLFGLELCGKALKVQGHGCNMATVVVEGSGRTPKQRDIAFEALEKLGKSINFTAGTIEVFVVPQFFRRFFFVVIT